MTPTRPRLLEPPPPGRVFRMRRTIRLSDTTAAGSLRLDAAARYMQDAAVDDVADAGIDDGPNVWVVRRAELDLRSPFVTDERVEVSTWSRGLGPRWAARRTTIAGDAGGRIEAEATWVYVNAHTMRAARLPASYHQVYGRSDGEPEVSIRLGLHREPPGAATRLVWPLRITDVDMLGHVNNAVHWEAVETLLGPARTGGPLTCHGVMEYRQAIAPLGEIALEVVETASGFSVWFVAEGEVAAAAQVSDGSVGALPALHPRHRPPSP